MLYLSSLSQEILSSTFHKHAKNILHTGKSCWQGQILSQPKVPDTQTYSTIFSIRSMIFRIEPKQVTNLEKSSLHCFTEWKHPCGGYMLTQGSNVNFQMEWNYSKCNVTCAYFQSGAQLIIIFLQQSVSTIRKIVQILFWSLILDKEIYN